MCEKEREEGREGLREGRRERGRLTKKEQIQASLRERESAIERGREQQGEIREKMTR